MPPTWQWHLHDEGFVPAMLCDIFDDTVPEKVSSRKRRVGGVRDTVLWWLALMKCVVLRT